MIPIIKQKPFWIILSFLSVILIIFAFILLIPSSSPAAPVIIWSPSSITETISPGGSKTLNVTFTSSKDMSDVSVWIVPGLKPYVSVQPETFPQIQKGQTNNITITFPANQDSPLGTFDGTIHLREGNKTCSKTFKILLKVVTPQTIMSDFLHALEIQDIDKLIENFRPEIQDEYKNAFEQAKNDGTLLDILEDYRTLEVDYISSKTAQYKIRVKENGEIFTYYIVLMKDRYGVWKVYSL